MSDLLGGNSLPISALRFRARSAGSKSFAGSEEAMGTYRELEDSRSWVSVAVEALRRRRCGYLRSREAEDFWNDRAHWTGSSRTTISRGWVSRGCLADDGVDRMNILSRPATS